MLERERRSCHEIVSKRCWREIVELEVLASYVHRRRILEVTPDPMFDLTGYSSYASRRPLCQPAAVKAVALSNFTFPNFFCFFVEISK